MNRNKYRFIYLIFLLFVICFGCFLPNLSIHNPYNNDFFDSCVKYRNSYRMTILSEGDTFFHSALSEQYHFWNNIDGKHIIFLDSIPILQYEQFDNKLNGKYIVYYNNGKIKTEGYYFMGKRNGLFNFYYETGKHKMQGHYYDNKKICLWYYWEQNDSLIKVEDYGEFPR